MTSDMIFATRTLGQDQSRLIGDNGEPFHYKRCRIVDKDADVEAARDMHGLDSYAVTDLASGSLGEKTEETLNGGRSAQLRKGTPVEVEERV